MTVRPLPQLEDLAKSSLVDDRGRRYADFRGTLRTSWPTVARDLLLGYLMLAASVAAIVAARGALPALGALRVAIGSLLIGFWMAYLQLFLHEAAHFNIHPDRRWNDWLANSLIAVWVGTDIREYRRIHWDHHRFLGQPNDTERSYFSALNWRFVLETLFFVSAIRVIAHRRARVQDGSAAAAAAGGAPMLVIGVFVHLLVLGASIWMREYELALAWLAGNLMVYPLFGALRQLLEHRDSDAMAGIDYSVVPHGKLTRSFKAGPLGSFLGGAGFRLHDIHHFDPELSYTCLPRVDEFLRHCEAAKPARSERRSYFRVAAVLWRG